MTENRKGILQEVEKVKEQVKAFRHHLHSHPELSFQEHATSAFIKETLEKAGLELTTGIAGTGMMLRIHGKGPGKVVALRADMDALPIQEKSDKPYCSQNDGVMHACGHDVHSSCLMGVALVMNALKNEWNGELRCIFQPGEEKLPGGASMMIKEGVLKSPDVECILAQHVFPELEAGQVGFRPGMYMASTDELYLKVIGKGGHGAMPHRNIDPVLISAHILVALQQIVSRRSDATLPCVLSFGKIQGDGATNVIPDHVSLEGTFRTFDEEFRKKAHGLIKEIAQGTAKAMGGNCEVAVVSGYPHLKNDEELTVELKSVAKEFLGEEKVFDLPLRMTAEDFSYFSHEIPACFYRLGTASTDGTNSASVHTSSFDIDEKALETGVGLMSALAMHLLK
jgi:amidohydrolase